MTLPALRLASPLPAGTKFLYISALGFEERGTDWLRKQCRGGFERSSAIMFEYRPAKGEARESELRSELSRLGIASPQVVIADMNEMVELEDSIERHLERKVRSVDEVIVDISGMSKLLILLTLCKLRTFKGRTRVIYAEMADYPPSRQDFEEAMSKGISLDVPFPSRGIESVVRAPAISSIRMQGQPVTLIAFTSFNEQLVRHIVASVSPHKLILIGCTPQRSGLYWRGEATQRLHQRLIDGQRDYNALDSEGFLVNRTSTLNYRETFDLLLEFHRRWGGYERMMVAATGSKMQTVGLGIAKQVLPDIHIEYPTPRSYYIKEGKINETTGVYEIVFENFRGTIDQLRRIALDFDPCYPVNERGDELP